MILGRKLLQKGKGGLADVISQASHGGGLMIWACFAVTKCGHLAVISHVSIY